MPAVRRIVVYGSGGSGKSTVAPQLAARLDVPHIEIDVLAFDDQQSYVGHAVLRERFAGALDATGWVVEGMHREQLGVALATADAFVWIDLPRRVIAWRLLRRSLALLLSRTERHGRRLTLRSFLSRELPFIAKTLRKHGARRSHGAAFATDAETARLTVVRLRTRGDVARLVAQPPW